jgi:hypothetical protein
MFNHDDLEAIAEQARLDQIGTGARDLAILARTVFDAFITAGFDTDQATGFTDTLLMNWTMRRD